MSELDRDRSEARKRQDAASKRSETISLLDIVLALVKRRWLIIGVTLVAAVVILGLSMYSRKAPPGAWNPMPNVFRSQVKILISEDDGTVSAPDIGTTQSTLNLLVGEQRGANANLALARELLFGNAIRDAIAEELDFYEKYGLAEADSPLTAARSVYDEALSIPSEGGGGNILVIAYDDGDPEFAYRVLTRVTELLQERFRSLSLEKTLRKKRFIEERLLSVEQDVRAAQRALSDFQNRYGSLDISAQAQRQSDLIADMRAEIIKTQMEIEVLREYLPDNDPRIQRLRQEIERKTEFVENLRRGSETLADAYIPQEEMSSITYRYLGLQGELDVQQAVYRSLRQEYESVKIEEADNSRVFQILEPAEIPELKSRPSRARTCMIVTVAAFFISVFLAFILEYFEHVGQDPVESQKLHKINSMLRLRKER